MDEPSFKLHTDSDETFSLAPRAGGRLLPVALARIMGPTPFDKAQELADRHGYDLEEQEDGTRMLIGDERHELPRLNRWRLVWAQLAPHILEGVEHEDVDPSRVCVPEVARAFLYWRTAGRVGAAEWDAILGGGQLAQRALEGDRPEPDTLPTMEHVANRFPVVTNRMQQIGALRVLSDRLAVRS